MGAYVKFNDSVWIVINPDDVGSVTGNTDGTDHVALGMRDAARLFAAVGSQTPAVTGEYAFTAFNGVTMEYDPDLDGQEAWIATGYWSADGQQSAI